MSSPQPFRPCGIPIGWSGIPEPKSRIGFQNPPLLPGLRQLLLHKADDHLMTIAPTGRGKGRCCIIPALLTYPGSTFTIDVKGENYQVTARRRRQMGHKVVAIDPFGQVLQNADTINPLDLLNLPGAQADCTCEMLSEMLCGGMPLSRSDTFWEINGKALNTGLIGLSAEDPDLEKRNLGTVLDYLYADEVDYGIAKMLDSHTFTNKLARQELAGYLQNESDKCRPSIRSTAQCMVKCLGSDCVRASLARTSFDLTAWLRGDPIDIYLIFPADKLESHKALLRLIVGTLMNVLLNRKTMPAHRTLLLLDECALLGGLSHVKTALTLLRGYGVQCWTFWQDLDQIKQCYPVDWATLVNNSGVLQTFGLNNGLGAKALAETMLVQPEELLNLRRNRQMVLIPGKGTKTLKKVDYLKDRMFSGLFDPNPRFAFMSR